MPFHENQDLHAIAWNGTSWRASNEMGEMLTAAPGQAWSTPQRGSYTFRDAAVSNGDVIFVGASGEITTWKSDGTFSNTFISSTSWLNAIEANGSQFIAVGSGGRIAQYSSYWVTRTSGTTVDLHAVARCSGSTWIAAGNGGTILKSTTSGSTWTAVTSPVTSALYAAAAAPSGNPVIIVGQSAVRSTNGGTSFSTLPGFSGTFHDVIWAGSQFVTVGVNGQIATSPDGASWTFPPRVTTQTLRRVAYGGGTLRAVGDGGTVVESGDGISWRLVSGNGSKRMSEVVHGAGGWLAVGEVGALERESAEGRMPSMVQPGGKDIYRVVAGNGQFLTVSGVSHTVRASTDGVEWVVRPTPLPTNTSIQMRALAWTGERFLFAGEGGRLYASGDGIEWSEHPIATTETIKKIAWSGSQAVAIGSGNSLWTSPEGITWTARGVPSVGGLTDVTWAGDRWVAMEGTGTAFLTSPDGIAWERHLPVWPADKTPVLFALAWNGTRLAVVGNGLAGGKIATSTDGVNWTLQDHGSIPALWSISSGGGEFLAAGDGGCVLSSGDGLAWEFRAGSPTGRNFSRMETIDGTLFATGALGAMLTSKDGIRWELRSSNTISELKGIARSDERYVAVGYAGAIVVSEDGRVWRDVSRADLGNFINVVWDGSRFIALNSVSQLVSSADGLTWQIETLPETGLVLNEIASGGGRTVAVGNLGKILVSAGGAWQAATGVTSPSVRSVAWDGSVFRAICQDGVLLSSPDGAVWSPAGTLSGSPNPSRIRWLGDRWAVMDQNGVYLSSNATSWSYESFSWQSMMTDVARRPGGLVAVGMSGDILLSDGFESWLRTQGFSFRPTTPPEPQLGRLLVAYAMGLAASDAPRWPTIAMPPTGTGTLIFETPNPPRKNLRIEVESSNHPAGPWHTRWSVRPDGMMEGDPGTTVSTPTFKRRRFQIQLPAVQGGSQPREFFRVSITPD